MSAPRDGAAHPLDGSVPERLRAIAAELRAALGDVDGIWLVGGVVRDALLGRDLPDVDVVVPAGRSEAVARAWARASGGAPFPLGDRFGCWRVTSVSGGTARGGGEVGGAQVDVCNLRGVSIDDDLALRDLTINAMAVSCADPDAGVVDSSGGLVDLAAGRVRMVAERSFDDDPLRMVRVARFAHALDFDVDDATAAAVRSRVALAVEPSGERTFDELAHLLLLPEARRAVRRLESLGLVDTLLPELAACRGIVQSRFHHLDVYEHTLAVLDNVEDLAAAPAFWLGEAGEPLPVQVQLALRVAALCHDLGKPSTRTERADGRIGFPGHDVAGVAIAHDICDRWRTSRALRDTVATLVRTHLRLGQLLHEPFDARASYRYRRAIGAPVAEAVLLSCGDRLATAGVDDRRRWVRMHLEVAGELWRDHWREVRDGRPPALLDGTRLAEVAGIEPGPALGGLVAALAEEQAVGAVTTAAEAERFVAGLAASRAAPRDADA